MMMTLLFASLLYQDPPLIRSLEGKDLFASSCASCHGMDARGSGPASAAMKTRPPDLTRLSSRNGGKFPQAAVLQMLTGEKMKRSHGSSEMPVWGPIFRRVERDQDLGPVRINNVVKYLESIQGRKK